MSRLKIVVVGGGFGGLNAVASLRKCNVDITLIDRRNFHLFQPLLYQVATGGLSPANIASPLRSILSRQKNALVLLGEVTGFDIPNKQILIQETRVPFDILIVAAGSQTSYLGHPEWEKLAPGLKSIEDATEIRRRVLTAFETAEKLGDNNKYPSLMTFVIVGGGPTGVELAGAISELAHTTLRNDFRNINPEHTRIILVEGHEYLLPNMPVKLSENAKASLQKMKVEVLNKHRVQEIHSDHVLLENSLTHEKHRIDTNNIIWAAGVHGAPIGEKLAKDLGITLDRGGRIPVQNDCTIAGHPDIFVIGDLAAMTNEVGKPLPGVAQVAMQQGHYVAQKIRAKVDQKSFDPPFHYFDKGNMATIGRAKAVVDMHWIQFSGWFAWVAWLFVHITYLIQFQNRILVMSQWAWNYFTRNRSARLITGDAAQHPQLIAQLSEKTDPLADSQAKNQ